MKTIKLFLSVLLISFAVHLCAQNLNEPKNNKINKINSRAKIEEIKGQTALVLKTGRKEIPSNWGASYSNNIVIAYDDDTKKILDSLIVAPWGTVVIMKDLDGYKVDVAKAKVDSKVGLMFTSGSKCATLKKEELDALK